MDKLIDDAVKMLLAEANEHFYKIIVEGDNAQKNKVKVLAPTLKSLEKLVRYAIDANGSPRSRRWAVVVLLWLIREFPRVRRYLRGLKLLRSNIGEIVFDEHEDLRTVCAALVAMLWSSNAELNSIWPRKLFKHFDPSAFPADPDLDVWLEELKIFVARCSPIRNSAVRSYDSSYQVIAIGIGKQRTEDHLRFLCIIDHRWLIIMSAKPHAKDIFFLEAPLNKISDVRKSHKSLVDTTSGSQQDVPVLVVKLAQDSSIVTNCTFNTEHNRLISLDLYLRNDGTLREAHEKLQRAIMKATGPLMDMGVVFFASQSNDILEDGEEGPEHAVYEKADTESAADETRSASAAQRSMTIELGKHARIYHNPVDVRIHEHTAQSKKTKTKASKVLVQDSLKKMDLVNKTHEHAIDPSKAVRVTTTSALKRGSGRLPKKQLMNDVINTDEITSSSAKKLRLHVEPTSALTTTRNLRSKKVLMNETARKGDPAKKKSSGLNQDRRLEKAVSSRVQEPDDRIWDVPSSGSSRQDAQNADVQAKPRRRPAVEDADEDRNQPDGDRDLLATLPTGTGTQKLVPSAKPGNIVRKSAQKTSASLTKEKIQHKVVVQSSPSQLGKKFKTKSMNATRIQTNKAASGGANNHSRAPEVDTRSLDELEDAVMNDEQQQATTKLQDEASWEAEMPVSSQTSAARSSGMRQAIPLSARRQHNMKQDDLADENIVKKQTLVSFGPKGSKNQASPAFGQMLDDDDHSSGGPVTLGTYFQSSTQKLLSATSQPTLDDASSATKGNPRAKVGEQISSSRSKMRPKAPSSAQLLAKRPKAATDYAETTAFAPFEQIEVEIGACENDDNALCSRFKKFERLVTADGSVVAPDEEVQSSVHVFSPLRQRSMRQPNFHDHNASIPKPEARSAKTTKRRLWSLLVDDRNQLENAIASKQDRQHATKRPRLPLKHLDTQPCTNTFKGFNDIDYSQSRSQSQRQNSRALAQSTEADIVDLTQLEDGIPDEDDMVEDDRGSPEDKDMADHDPAAVHYVAGMDDILAARQLHAEQTQYNSSVEPAPVEEQSNFEREAAVPVPINKPDIADFMPEDEVAHLGDLGARIDAEASKDGQGHSEVLNAAVKAGYRKAEAASQKKIQVQATTPLPTKQVKVAQTPLVEYPSSDDEMADKEPLEGHAGAGGEEDLQPHHQNLLTNLYGLARRLIAQVMETEKAMTAEVNAYFDDEHGVARAVASNKDAQLTAPKKASTSFRGARTGQGHCEQSTAKY